MSKWVVHCKKSRFDVYVGRPSEYGNEFEIGKNGTRKEVIEKHKQKILADPMMIEKIKRELRGKILGCWCSPKPCHASTLAAIANDEPFEEIQEEEKEMDLWE